MKRYLKLAFYYLKVRLVARLRKRFLIKVLQQEDSQLLSDLDQVGLPVKSWIQGIRKKPSLYASPAKGVLDVLKDRLPQHIEGTIKDAERVLAHEFDMLGSGPFTPIDPDATYGIMDISPLTGISTRFQVCDFHKVFCIRIGSFSKCAPGWPILNCRGSLPVVSIGPF